ncbi:MAG: flippase-like domain-containing protein [Chloroflexi bacterium]|nr:flippase-like domain-containing protein [Chloroflexota bacterium]
MRRFPFLRLGLGLAISVAAIVLIARTVSANDVLESVRAGNPLLLIPAVALYFVGLGARSLRWRVLLVNQPVGLVLLFRTLVIGFTVNDILPARIGELARIVLLARKASIPSGISFASIIAERVLDGLVVTAFLIVGLIRVPGDEGLRLVARFATVVFVALTLGIVAAALAPDPFRRVGLALARLAPGHWTERLTRLVHFTLEGLAALTAWRTAGLALGLSILVWTIEATTYRIIMLGFPVPGGMTAAVMGTGVANLATLVPSSPGYVGTFDAALQSTLVGAFQAVPSEALAFTVVVHLAVLVPVVILGLVYIWQEGFTLGGLSRVSSQPRPEASRDVDEVEVDARIRVGAGKRGRNRR